VPQKVYHHIFNVGVVDEDKLHRVDLDRMRMASADQTNLLCESVGRMFARPGTAYLHANKTASSRARLLPFISGEGDAFVVELTDGFMRVTDAQTDELVTRPAVTAALTNGDFAASAGWTLAATSGQSSTVSGGVLRLSARGLGAEASAKQTLTINEVGTVHALDIVVSRGPVTFRLGSSANGDEYIDETQLETGYHSLAFTPTGASAYVQFLSKLVRQVRVDSCVVASAGVMALVAPWNTSQLPRVQRDQSIDVMFLACRGVRPQRIERRGDASWSIVDYKADDGPFLAAKTAQIKLTPSVIDGNGTLTASSSFFSANHIGALFRLEHKGQRIDSYIAGEAQATPTIKVTGVNETNYNDRDFTFTLAGTWAGTVKVQRSFDSELTGFQEFRREQGSSTIDITANATYIDDDNEDNVTAWYRLAVEDGDYTSGEIHITAQYNGGGGEGICRVVGYNSPTEVDIEVLTPFKGTYATEEWSEGAWSGAQGYPSACAFAEGRLFFVGDDSIWGSISDAYTSFDETFAGDAGPLLRSIALGGRNEARFLLPLSTLAVGTDSRMASIGANSIGDILTPDNLKVAHLASIGGAERSPLLVGDDRALFVEKSTAAIYELTYSPEAGKYVATPFSRLTTDLFSGGVLEMAMSVMPDQRIWVCVEDEDAVCIVFEPTQKVVAFVPISTSDDDDIIESVCVVPGSVQDRVYFSIKRVVDGSTVRYTEKLARDSEAAPGTLCKTFDSHVVYGAGVAALTGLDHLEGETVCAWVDGAPILDDDGELEEFTVSSGGITLPAARVSGAVVGKPVSWSYESARLEYGAPNSTPVMTNKAVSGVSLLLSNSVRSGINIGTRNGEGTLSRTTKLPKRRLGKEITPGVGTDIISGVAINEPVSGVPGDTSLDTRLRLTGNMPVSFLAMVLALEAGG
jgi:hypothetical protein